LLKVSLKAIRSLFNLWLLEEWALSIYLLFRIILSNLGTLSAGAPVKNPDPVVAGAN
jgi:hypothetical protein